jgi:hypothetical protein
MQYCYTEHMEGVVNEVCVIKFVHLETNRIPYFQ